MSNNSSSTISVGLSQPLTSTTTSNADTTIYTSKGTATMQHNQNSLKLSSNSASTSPTPQRLTNQQKLRQSNTSAPLPVNNTDNDDSSTFTSQVQPQPLPSITITSSSPQIFNTASDQFIELPNEILVKMFSYLDTLDLLHTSAVCHSWRQLAIETSVLWHSLFISTWPTHPLSIAFRDYHSNNSIYWYRNFLRKKKIEKIWLNERIKDHSNSLDDMKNNDDFDYNDDEDYEDDELSNEPRTMKNREFDFWDCAIHTNPITAITFNNDRIISGGFYGEIKYYDWPSSSLQSTLSANSSSSTNEASNQNLISHLGEDMSIAARELNEGTLESNLVQEDAGRIWALSWYQSGKYVLSTHDKLTDILLWKLPLPSDTHHNNSSPPSHATHHNYIDSSSVNYMNAHHKDRLFAKLRGHTDIISCLAVNSSVNNNQFSSASSSSSSSAPPSSEVLVSGSLDSRLRVWDVEKGVSVATLSGHTDAITNIQFSLDASSSTSNVVVSAACDGSVKIWDVHNGICIRTMQIGINHTAKSFEARKNMSLIPNLTQQQIQSLGYYYDRSSASSSTSSSSASSSPTRSGNSKTLMARNKTKHKSLTTSPILSRERRNFGSSGSATSSSLVAAASSTSSSQKYLNMMALDYCGNIVIWDLMSGKEIDTIGTRFTEAISLQCDTHKVVVAGDNPTGLMVINNHALYQRRKNYFYDYYHAVSYHRHQRSTSLNAAPNYNQLQSLQPDPQRFMERRWFYPPEAHASLKCFQFDEDRLVAGTSKGSVLIWRIKDNFSFQ